jgi:hypothetical protein
MVVNQEGGGLPLKPIKTGRVGVDQDNVEHVSTSNGSTVPCRYSGKRNKLKLLIMVLSTVVLSVRG